MITEPDTATANLSAAIAALRDEVDRTRNSLRSLNRAQAACQCQIRAVRKSKQMRLVDVMRHPPSITHSAETILSGRYKPSAEMVIDIATEILAWQKPSQDADASEQEHAAECHHCGIDCHAE